MQAEQVQTVSQYLPNINPPEQDAPLYDFTQCKRIKKLTTHDIYKFNHQNTPLIVKLFAPEALKNYQQEVDYLTLMTCPQTLKIMYHRTSLNPLSCEALEKSHLIVLREATRGDLNDYLPRFGRMSEKMARTYFLQLIEGLSAGSRIKPPIIHPNLQASSILLGQSGQLYICGWSEIASIEQKVKLQECVFSCGEILICLLTSFMPFYKKYSSTDAFYKFINSEHIHKFWQELQKRMYRVDKKFFFSAELKKLIEGIFLKKIKSFEQIQKEQWMKGEIYTHEELLALLQQNQQIKNQKIQVKRKLQVANEQKRKKALRDFELSYGLQRSSETDDQQFIKDYQSNMIKQEDLPSGNCNFKVEGTPGIIVASLMQFLRQENGKSSVMVGEQFVLSNHKIVKIKNFIIIDLIFAVSLLEEEEEEGFVPPTPADTVALKLKMSFFKDQKQVFGEVQALQSNFNSYYTNLALRYLQERIQNRRAVQMQHLQHN